MAVSFDDTACQEWNFANENVTLYVLQVMGPRCLSWLMILLTEIIYTIILTSGVVGNLIICFVITREKSMHVPTNYYLFSLAVSDLLSLLMGLPFELLQARYAQWPYQLPAVVCKTRAYVSELTTYASVLTITAFSIERWIAICFPLKLQAFSKFKRAVRLITLVWLVAIGSAFPVFYSFYISELDIPQWLFEQQLNPSDFSSNNRTLRDTNHCYLDSVPEAVLISASFWIFFILPMFVLLVLYSHIAIVIRSSGQHSQVPNSRKHSAAEKKSHRGSVRMLPVVLTFFICYLPFHVQRLSSNYTHGESDSSTTSWWAGLFYISGFFYYSNSALNPLLYNLLNAKFRRALRSSLHFCRQQRKHSEFQQSTFFEGNNQSRWTSRGLTRSFASETRLTSLGCNQNRLKSLTASHWSLYKNGSLQDLSMSQAMLKLNNCSSPFSSTLVINTLKQPNNGRRKLGLSGMYVPPQLLSSGSNSACNLTTAQPLQSSYGTTAVPKISLTLTMSE